MENINIYENIGKRTGGDIYIGVVGPVRAGKSTFIKRFMDLMVIPNVKNAYEKQRLIDEMPQSGTGRTVMTTEPKFIPADAAELQISGSLSLKVRMVDCVGYMIPGALGQMEDGVMRMVDTPWSDEKIPFEEAAEIGTEKVIREHSTVGIVVTTDGTIGTLERSSYEAAEEKVIRQLTEMRKPFVIILNSTDPSSDNAAAVAAKMEEKYGMPVMRMNCARAGEVEIEGSDIRHAGVYGRSGTGSLAQSSGDRADKSMGRQLRYGCGFQKSGSGARRRRADRECRHNGHRYGHGRNSSAARYGAGSLLQDRDGDDGHTG